VANLGASASASGTAASSATAANVQTITSLPNVCTSTATPTVAANAVASNPTATQILTNGFNAQTAATSIGTQLSQVPSTNPLAGYVIVVVAFGTPSPNSQGGVVLSLLVNVIGAGSPSTDTLNTDLCPILKVALAASAGISDSTTLQGCVITPLTTSPGKRAIFQNSNSTTTPVQMSSTIPAGSSTPPTTPTTPPSHESGSSVIFISVVALFVALFCLFL
jgi:hypothetical protein